MGMHDLVPSMSFVSQPGIDHQQSEAEKLRFNNYKRLEKNDFSDRPFKQRETERKTAANIKFSDEDIDLIFSSITSDLKKPGDISNAHPFAEKDKKELLIDSKTKVSGAAAVPHETSFIIQLHNKYILSQIKSGLMIIDQHVAHERILYEKALYRLEANLPFSQQLLFPKTLELDPGIYSIIKELNPFLIKLGFEIKFFSKNTIVIEGVPDDVKSGSEEKVLLDMIDEYAANQEKNSLRKPIIWQNHIHARRQ